MTDENKTARGPFRIATVAELTGVPEPTLRAWERRYGVPSPERTASGYRLYGQTEVDEVRMMRSLCDDGMAASEAARQVISGRVEGGDQAPATQAADPYRAAISAMLDSVMDFDVAGFEEEVRRLPLLGGVSMILDRVVVPFLREVGERWHTGEFSVANERLASERMSTFLRDLLRLATDEESPRERILLVCFAEEEHELGLLVTAIRLAMWGYRPVVLGGRMPPSALRAAVLQFEPKLVALSVTLPPTRARARELAEEYGATCGDVPWLVGGSGAHAISDLIEKFGGHTVDDEPEKVRGAIRELLRANEAPPAPRRARKSR